MRRRACRRAGERQGGVRLGGGREVMQLVGRRRGEWVGKREYNMILTVCEQAGKMLVAGRKERRGADEQPGKRRGGMRSGVRAGVRARGKAACVRAAGER